jgi:hypothetical protein
MADAEARLTQGIPQTFANSDPIGWLGDGWGVTWWNSPPWYANLGGDIWARADDKTIGYTEVGAGKGYDAWLATPADQRLPFDLDIPDRRITPGPPPHTALVDCGSYFCKEIPSSLPANRGTYHWSNYAHQRLQYWTEADGFAFIPIAYEASENLFLAETKLWQGDAAGAVAILNDTRVGNGQLPAATAADADLAEKLFYESLIENWNYCSVCAWTGRRRWGPLADGTTHHFGMLQGTQLNFAPPGADLQTLNKLVYTYGGLGEESGALAASSDPYCQGPGCGGGAAPVSAFGDGLRGGSSVPASAIHRLDGAQVAPATYASRVTRYQ